MELRRVALPVLLASLLVLAGCSGASQLSSPDEPTEEELPPGVSQDGVDNASTLVDAHSAALNESGYAYRVGLAGSVNVNDSETSTAYETNLTQTSRAEPGGRPAFVTADVRSAQAGGNQSQTVAYWWNDTTTLARFSAGEQTQYAAFDQRPGEGQLYAPDDQYLRQIVGASNFSVSGVDRSGEETLITLTATEANASLQGVTEYNATVVVDSEGRIHSARQYAVVESGQGTQTVDLHYELTATSVETVAQPEWADEALGNRTTA
ncbi:hypothetical protein SAMN04487949_2661 [Halogranum gelatinilyticum]|uniref:Uncharacterized protein n=1 Tax=Halogranum gelatinilyticum TaxID=660521 RepID=A0A1G9WA92_9EURY|nr:hypothetical protein [Halogranum gelatinilyticum]SDM80915.1 hypothetical protein SAMN04487949_2661 [Halogranum gelatinilyticum]